MTPAQKYVEDAIKSFISDPPDSPFQRGYLSALLTVWDEAFDSPVSDVADEARRTLDDSFNTTEN